MVQKQPQFVLEMRQARRPGAEPDGAHDVLHKGNGLSKRLLDKNHHRPAVDRGEKPVEHVAGREPAAAHEHRGRRAVPVRACKALDRRPAEAAENRDRWWIGLCHLATPALVVLFNDGFHTAAFSNNDLKALVDYLSSGSSLCALSLYVKLFIEPTRKPLKTGTSARGAPPPVSRDSERGSVNRIRPESAQPPVFATHSGVERVPFAGAPS